MSAEAGSGRVLVDTSVWVDYFRGRGPEAAARLDELMEAGEICVPAVVLAELIQGARTEAEVRTIEDLVDAFRVIDQRDGTWVEAGKLAFGLRKKGKSTHLTDCYIAVIARQHGCSVLTHDAHFRDIRTVFDFPLIEIRGHIT